MGAAKTGSGKTLAFLVPVLENLYRLKWSDMDGLGALIISPTRELAIQIFEVLRKIGQFHNFSAGLVIGGKNLKEERDRLSRMNILVCTPGRLLQHMDQTSGLGFDNLQMLVLDEADRILDMGFSKTLNAIVENLPAERQTLLFSATQTKNIEDLARLSLSDPEFISVHESASSSTPTGLQQHYIVTPLPEKLNTLYSFLRMNTNSKIIVFLSSGKQVRFVYESFRQMHIGIPLLHLHGKQKQTARLDVTMRFSSAKNSCLFATDVVARGLDFPAVDWVLQVDCPEDAETYIHRVGRTARFERNGRGVLFLCPSEEAGMLKALKKRKVPIDKINVKEKKQQSIQNQLQNLCFKDPELKYLGQKAFVSYVRSIHIQHDKEVFKLSELPLEEFSTSLGLPGAPRIKFLKGDNAKELKNAPQAKLYGSDEDTQPKEVRTKYDRMFQRRNQDVLADHYKDLIDNDGSGDDAANDASEDDTFLSVKRRGYDHVKDAEEKAAPRIVHIEGHGDLVIDSKRREKLLQSKKALSKLKGKGKKLVYDENGEAHEIYELQDEDDFKAQGDASEQRRAFVETEREKVQKEDVEDKALVKQKRREKKDKRKAREREEDQAGEEVGVQLAEYDGGADASEGDDEPVQKRPKKWFEEDGKRKAAQQLAEDDEQYVEPPTSLAELEALAGGLLD
jgi:ATP-dependent RNA helicase DDX10/DBP4